MSIINDSGCLPLLVVLFIIIPLGYFIISGSIAFLIMQPWAIIPIILIIAVVVAWFRGK